MEASTGPSSFSHFPSIVAAAEGGQPLSSNPTFVDKSDYQSFYNYKASKGRTLLRDQTTLATELPTLLPKGLHYIANFVSFEDLYSDGAFKQSKRNLVSITSEHLSLLYRAKCIDRGLIPSWEREVRFMEFLSCNCKGNFFCLPESGLGPASAEVIKCILSNNKTYSVLDLSDNYLRDEGALSIGELLRVNRTLVHVGLGSNDISHKGASAIANALEDNKTVVSLDLGAKSGVNANHIGSQGAEALGMLLKVNQVLSKLDLGSNGLVGHQCGFFASALGTIGCVGRLLVRSGSPRTNKGLLALFAGMMWYEIGRYHLWADHVTEFKRDITPERYHNLLSEYVPQDVAIEFMPYRSVSSYSGGE